MARMQGHRDAVDGFRLVEVNLDHGDVIDVPYNEPVHP